jgi:hypothetical protein
MKTKLRITLAASLLVTLHTAHGTVFAAGVGNHFVRRDVQGGAANLPAASASEIWWEIRLGGQPTGWERQSVEPSAGGSSRTTQEMLFVINRLGSKVEIKTLATFGEDAAGRLQTVHTEVSSSQQTTVLDGTRTATGIEVHTTAGGRSYTRTLPVAGPLLGPRGIAALCRTRLHAPGDTVSFLSFAAEASAIGRTTRTVTATAQLDGRPAIAVKESTDLNPGEQELWLDAQGEMVRTSAMMPFGKVETLRTDRETAHRAAAGSELPQEAYDRTMARSNVRLPDPRGIDTMKIRLTHKRPELGWPAFDGPAERVIEKTPTSLVLETWRPALPGLEGAGAVPAGGAGGVASAASAAPATSAAELAPNALLQSDDPEVVRLASAIAGAERDPYTVARKLQDWTSAHMDLDLGIALAPASEVVRNRRGTCIAFAVLLASLERAAGIPSRIAMGFVYYEGIWGGHAWTEVRIGGRWIPLDAAVYRPGPADAARFQFSSYTAEDNLGAANAAGMQTYGNVEVTVLEYTRNGRTVQVPADARPFSVSGETYLNPWLGVSIRKPAGSRFTALDAVYPDPTIVAMESGETRLTVGVQGLRESPADAIAKLLAEVDPAAAPDAAEPSRSAAPAAPPVTKSATTATRKTLLGGRPAAMVSSPDKARLVVADGESLWVLTASGARAADLIEEVAAGWQWTSPL